MTVLVVALVLSNLLLVGLLLWERTACPVLPTAEAQTVARGGKYVAATANFNSNEMCLYLVDETTDRMFVYSWDESKRLLRRLAVANLRQDFERPEVEDRSRER